VVDRSAQYARAKCLPLPIASRAVAGDAGGTFNEEEIAMPAPLIVNFHMPIDAQDREVMAELQSMLVELIDLALIGKQAHWNVEGPHFRSLHLELDELVDTWRTLGDQVAERGVTLGGVPDGQAATVASFSQIAPLPAGHLRDYDVVREVADRVTEVAARARARIEAVASHDPVSEDLLIAVAGTLEKQLWMLRVQHPHA
jgi:starvation-inducible DNA-binding protein